MGYEALLRATTPDGTVVMPDVLFPAAHEAGWTHLVDRIGRTTALRDAASWLPPEQLLFINFIPTSIYRPEVCLQTTELAAQDAGISLSQIVFEVTEGHEVRDLGHLEHVFDYYRSHDCKVALDDLGAGYSSLNILVRLRPDIVKLDKELVQALPDPTARTVISAIVDITKSYGGQVLAECIETEQQAVVALELGVDLGQGWLFGRPERPAVKPTALASPRKTAHPARPDRAPSLLRPAHVEPGRPDKAVAVTLPEHLHAASSGPAGMDGLLARAVDGSDSGVVVVDMLAEDQPMLYVNPAFERMTGYSSGDVVGRNCRLLQSADTDPAGIRGLSQAIRHGQEHRCVVLNQRKNGTLWWNELHLSPVRDEVGQLTHYLGYQHDVSDRVRAEQDLSRQATQDSLTGLANRGHLFEYLELALQAAADASRAVAVLFLDLDGFKDVNDKHGHAAGDAVLVQLAERLRVTLRTSDLICRNGGDEFVVVLGDLDPFDAGRIAARASVDVNGALRRPFLYPPHILHLGVSVGLALFPEDATSSDRLLAAADSDMYRVKRQRITQGEPALDQY